MAPRRKYPKAIGGGWFLLPDGDTKVQGFDAAYRKAGLDPDEHRPKRRTAAARQRQRAIPIENRRRIVASLLVQRVPLRVIAQRTGAALGTIHSDVEAIRAEWRERRRGDFDEFVVQELEVLENDEYRLRVRESAAPDVRTANATYDRVFKVLTRRHEMIGVDAPAVSRVLVGPDDAEQDAAQGAVFRFRDADSPEERLASLRRAQGLE